MRAKKLVMCLYIMTIFLGNTGEKCVISSTCDAREPLTYVLSESGAAHTPVPHLNMSSVTNSDMRESSVRSLTDFRQVLIFSCLSAAMSRYLLHKCSCTNCLTLSPPPFFFIMRDHDCPAATSLLEVCQLKSALHAIIGIA